MIQLYHNSKVHSNRLSIKVSYTSIKIDFSNNAFQILNGTEGKYSLSEIERCVVLP